MSDLVDGEPTPVTIRRAQTDGYRQTVNREVVFLIKSHDQVTGAVVDVHAPRVPGRLGRRSGAAEVSVSTAADSTATVSVKAGPPPAPLAKVSHPDREWSGDGEL
jgi:hypothetical protein